MINKWVSLLILLLIIFVSSSQLVLAQTNDSYTINQGKLNVTDADISEASLILEGDWEFYWASLLSPEDFQHSGSHPSREFIQAPSIWSAAKYTGDELLSNDGYGTYRLRILLNEDDADNLLAFYLPSVASAFKLWVNGELLASNGNVATNREHEKPKSYSQVVSFVPGTTELEVIMQVSNFSQRKGGMWAPIEFGSDHLITKQREFNLIREIVIASSLISLAIYLIAHYFFRAATTLPLFLGGFCLLVSLRMLLVGELLLIYLFPDFSWELSVKLEYLSFYIGFMLIVLFLYHLFPNEMNRKVVYISIVIYGLFSLTTLLPAYIYTHFILAFEVCLAVTFLFCVYTVTLALIRRREGALLNFLSIIFLVIAGANDIFYYNYWIKSIDLTPIAGATFLIAQTLIVAKKSSNAFTQVENLSKELHNANELLEYKVAIRTKDIEEKNQQLEQIEQSRKAFFSSVAHEIGTPMQSIHGFIQLIQNKVNPEEQETYLNIVDEKAKLITHLSKDLLDLAKLDEGQFEFNFEEVDAVYLLEHLYSRFKHEIERAGVISEFTTPTGIPEGYRIFMQVDVIRMEQVFSNLISNALRFTPKGGKIRLRGTCEVEERANQVHSVGKNGVLHIELIDTGSGIEPELLSRIFNRFTKGKDVVTKKVGSGLGLSISQEIIKSHGGKIEVTSEVGKGSCFIIKLPIIFIRGGSY